jgi:hypothetical protein
VVHDGKIYVLSLSMAPQMVFPKLNVVGIY